jgi:hypothetical protein
MGIKIKMFRSPQDQIMSIYDRRRGFIIDKRTRYHIVATKNNLVTVAVKAVMVRRQN